MLAEGGWAHTGIFAKGIGEVIGIGIAAHLRNLGHAVRVIEQELLRVT